MTSVRNLNVSLPWSISSTHHQPNSSSANGFQLRAMCRQGKMVHFLKTRLGLLYSLTRSGADSSPSISSLHKPCTESSWCNTRRLVPTDLAGSLYDEMQQRDTAQPVQWA